MAKDSSGLVGITRNMGEWGYYVFDLIPPSGKGKKRRVEVFCLNLEGAMLGTGKAYDEKIQRVSLSGADAKFRKTLCRKKAGSRELALFYRDLADCVESGTSIQEALELSAANAKSPYFRGVIGGLCILITKAGKSLSAAATYYPGAFNEVALALIEAGEKSGNLGPILRELATVAEEAGDIRGKVIGALIYPVIAIGIVCASAIVLVKKVLPQTRATFEDRDVEMPPVTQMMIDLVDLYEANRWIIYIPLVIVSLLFIFREEIIKSDIFQRTILKVPIVGYLIKKAIIVRSLKVLSLLLASGVHVREAYDMVARAAGNVVYAGYYRAIYDNLRRGQDASVSFMSERHRIGKDGLDLGNRLRVAVRSGKTDEMLTHSAKEKKKQFDIIMQNLPKTIEPALIVCIAVIIGFIMMAAVLPNFVLLTHELKNAAGR